MELVQQAFLSTPKSFVWVLVVFAISFFVFFFTKGGGKEESVAKPEDLFERACEVAHGSWVVHSIQEALNDGIFIILKKDKFPYIKEDLDIPSRHPDFSDFEAMQEGDYVMLIPERRIENGLPTDNLSTFLRHARHIPAA